MPFFVAPLRCAPACGSKVMVCRQLTQRLSLVPRCGTREHAGLTSGRAYGALSIADRRSIGATECWTVFLVHCRSSPQHGTVLSDIGICRNRVNAAKRNSADSRVLFWIRLAAAYCRHVEAGRGLQTVVLSLLAAPARSMGPWFLIRPLAAALGEALGRITEKFCGLPRTFLRFASRLRNSGTRWANLWPRLRRSEHR